MFDSHYVKTVFVGYSSTKPGCWMFYEPGKRTFIESSQAVFDENTMPGLGGGTVCLDSVPEVIVQEQLFEDPELEDGDFYAGPGGEVDEAPLPQAPPQPAAPEQDEHIDPPHADPAQQQPLLPPQLHHPQPQIPQPLRRSAHANHNQALMREPDLCRTSTYPQVRFALPAEPPVDKFEVDDDALNEAIDTALLAMERGEILASREETLEFVFSGLVADKRWPPGLKHAKEPRSLREARLRPNGEGELWDAAANEELATLEKMGTIKLMALPSGLKAIPSKWVFKIKKDERGEVKRLKARMIARCDRQCPGFDYTETFAPTPRPPALRATFAIAAIEDLELHSVDVTAAFLNGKLDEEIYMKLPEGMNPESVVKLQASIYGLKQSARQWLKKLHFIFSSMGFDRVQVDLACWTYGKDETRVIVPTHIDDMTIAAKSLELVQWVKRELAKHVKIRDLGETKFLLGVEIIRDRERRAIGVQ